MTFSQDYALADFVRTTLQRAVKNKIVALSERRISFNQITDVSISRGSVVVTATVDPSVTDDTVTTTQSTVDSGSFTIVVDSYEFTSVPAAATSTTATDDLSSSADASADADGIGISRMQLLAIVIGGFVVTLIVGLTIIVVQRQRRDGNRNGRRSMVSHANPVYSAGSNYETRADVQGSSPGLDSSWRETNDMEC